MNWPKRLVTKGQQAPLHPAGSCPPCSVVRQAVRSAPTQTASKNSQFSMRGSAHASTSSASSVSAVFTGVENRLARSQAPKPDCERGAGAGSMNPERTQDVSCPCMDHLSFSAILVLNQFMNSEVTRLMLR